jgi:RimJ/RimL family protein N-acetyltransferase
MEALAAGDVRTASAEIGVELTPFVAGETWLWRIRAEQLRRSPEDAEWVARVALVAGVVVGHAGFHQAPDEEGMVEVGYSVDPLHRRHGYARAMLAALLERAEADPRALRVRASIRPDNAASLATIAGFGFVEVGEQWDEEDGLETIFERRV